MKIIYKELSNLKDNEFIEAINIYLDSFPANERQPVSLIKDRIENGQSKLHLGYKNKKIVCIALLWHFRDSDFVLLDYLAVDKKYRNLKIGSFFFSYLIKEIENYKKYLLIEVENYLYGNNLEERKKRINFYIKNGAYLLKDIPYLLPSLDNTKSTEMLLMMAPRYRLNYMNKKEIENIIKRLYFELYQKLENDAELNIILNKIPEHITFENNILK